jgi:uncharacterized protein (TIGR02266 family)
MLAEVMHKLASIDDALAADLSFAVAALFRAELAEGDALRDRLREAGAVISGVLSRLHAPELAAALDLAGPSLAKTLAVLYPARAGLERALEAANEPASTPEHSPPAMLFEKPLAVSFPKPREAVARVRASEPIAHETIRMSPSERPPGARAPSDRPVGLLHERPSARLRRNAVALEPDRVSGLVDQQGQRGTAPEDRRDISRAEFSIDVGLHTSSQFFAGISGDLSEGGLFVATYTPQPVGSELHLSFVLPGGTAIRTAAIVAWSRVGDGHDDNAEPGMGLRFYGLSDDDRRSIERFLKVRPPMIYEPSR